MLRPSVALLSLVLFAFPVGAQTTVEKARLARVAWSAFQCGTFAEMSGDKKEQARLFELGVKAARDFIEAVKSKEVPPDVANREVPMIVGMLLQGPTTDFIVGRIFENAMQDAFDNIVTKDSGGLPLEPSKYVNDEELRKSIARTKYLQANCVLIK